MALETDIVSISYQGDGVSVSFPFPAQFSESGEVSVARLNIDATTSLLLNTVDYAIQGGSGGQGTVILAAPSLLPVGTTLEISRFTPRQQPDRFAPNQGFPAKVVENRYDQLTRMIQELDERVDRALVLPRAREGTVTGQLPRGDRTNRVLAFDAEGEPYYAVDTSVAVGSGAVAMSDFGTQLIQSANAAAGLTLLGAQSNLSATGFGATVVQTPSADALRVLLGVQNKVNIFITDFGAVGDGLTDNTTAFNQAFAAAGLSGGVVIVPPGYWMIAGEAYCAASNVGLVGFGSKSIILNGSTDKAAIKWGATNPAGPQYFSNTVANIAFAQKVGVTPVAGNCGLKFSGQGKLRLFDIEHNPFDGTAKVRDGIVFDQVSQTMLYAIASSDCLNDGWAISDCIDLFPVNCRFDANGNNGWTCYDSEGLYPVNISCFGNDTGCEIGETGVRTMKNFFASNFICDSSITKNCVINQLRNGLFNCCWFSGADGSAVGTQDGLYLAGVGCKSLTFTGGGFLANTQHGVNINNVGGAATNIQFSMCWFGDNAGAGFGNGGYGLLISAGTTGQALGGSSKGNTTGGVQNSSGGTFTTANILT